MRQSIEEKVLINTLIRNEVSEANLSKNQIIQLLSDIDPAIGENVMRDLQDPLAAKYFADQRILEHMLASQLIDAVLSPNRLGTKIKLPQAQERAPVTLNPFRRNGHSPPRLSLVSS